MKKISRGGALIIKRIFSVFLVFAMLVSVISSSGFFVQKAEAASSDVVINLNGTQSQICQQFGDFVNSNASLKQLLVGLYPSGNPAHLSFGVKDDPLTSFDVYWTASSVTFDFVSDIEYGIQYSMYLFPLDENDAGSNLNGITINLTLVQDINPTATPSPTPTVTPTPTIEPDPITIELNGTQDEIASQFKTFIDGNAALKQTFIGALDSVDNSVYLNIGGMTSTNYPYFDLIWRPNDCIFDVIGGYWEYNKRYEMTLDYYNADTGYEVYPDYITIYVTFQPSETAFNDIENHWAKEDIEWMVDSGLMYGIDSTYFEPDGTLTRGMVVAILNRYYEGGYPGDDVSEDAASFKDSNVDAWWNYYVEWAYENGIVNGYEDGTFRPNDPVTRQDLATILVRYMENFYGYNYTGQIADKWGDEGKISDYAKEAVGTLAGAGVINGMGDGTFNPQGYATRAQVAKMFRELIGSIDGYWN